jgi:hypothetical protein
MEISEEDIHTYVIYKAVILFKASERNNIIRGTRSLTGLWNQERDQYLQFLDNFCNQLLQNLNVDPIRGEELRSYIDLDTDEIENQIFACWSQFENQYDITFSQAFPPQPVAPVAPVAPVLNIVDQSEVSCYDDRCAICLEEIENGTPTIQYSCYHCFHESCALVWLSTSGVCPICKLGQNILYRSNQFTQYY